MMRCCLTLCLWFCLLGLCRGKRILLLPMNFPSHVMQFVTIGEALMDKRHDVHLYTSVTNPLLPKLQQGKIKLILHEAAKPDFFSGFTPEEQKDIAAGVSKNTILEAFRKVPAGFLEVAENPIADQNAFQKLKDNDYELIIVDAFVMSQSLLILAYRLQVPFIALSTHYYPWLLRNPCLPSLCPTCYAVSYSEKMTFWERLYNTWTILDWTISPRSPFVDSDLVRKYAPEMKLVSLNEIATKAALWFIDTDFVLDYPRPMMPNEIHIGGLTTKPPQPLTPELESFITSNPHGAILLSFGSVGTILSESTASKFWTVFKQIKYNVIWRYQADDQPNDVPNNIHLTKWVPQNDILGHPLVKAFITHCGANSQFEALYHGVPMIGFPLTGEQPYNAKRTEYHGFSITLDINTFTVDQLLGAINTVINNKTYSDNIKKASTLYKDQPMAPHQRVVYWVERVLKYGAAHLRSHALDMPWYEYLMLDIIGLVVLVVAFITCLLLALAALIRRKCGKTKPKVD